jgi:shikimate kinase
VRTDSNIILLGFMGSGKSSTGRELATILNYEFVDMDQWIEMKNGKSISEIFSTMGEVYFRQEEKGAIEVIKQKRNQVISTGGGVWINDSNRIILLNSGWCVWLKVSAKQALKRVESNLSQRPLLASSRDPFAKIESLLKARNPIYSLSHSTIETDEKTPMEVALEIVELFKKNSSR